VGLDSMFCFPHKQRLCLARAPDFVEGASTEYPWRAYELVQRMHWSIRYE
jgi:hypothetical protein